MPTRDVIVIGASAGGLDPLCEIAANLPADLPAALCIVLHVSPSSPGMLAGILDRSGPLLAAAAKDGEHVAHGRIYVAPPDHHLLLERDVVRVQRGPRQNRHRPAIDPLFRSAATAYGQRAIGVILSGTLDDGTAGLRTLKRYGGIAVVQDPKDALFSGMPTSVLASMAVDHCVSAAEIAPLLVRLSSEVISEARSIPPPEIPTTEDGRVLRPSNFGCPSCGGVLWETTDDFRCHVGHSFTAENLIAEQGSRLEDSLWVAIRTLEENATLKRRMAVRFRERNADELVDRVEADAAAADAHARRLRDVLEQLSSGNVR